MILQKAQMDNEAFDNETWKPIRDWPGYYVSNMGKVCSRKNTSGKITPYFKMKKLSLHPDGRIHVGLWRNQEQMSAKVHRLVLEAFVGKCPKGKECSHINGDCTDNRLENLVWETPKENHARMVGHGTKPQGETSVLHKLSERQVKDIISFRHSATRNEIAKRFGVTPSNTSAIWNGRSWKHIARRSA